ncbi:hypothetical protein MHPYR_170004 [uncultured Mycobacterium sp.]|uniref:Uncharacterized protein n=1 Tax=uncultured Mycobacterium sp. TaxID=171292 RepID=A0A1Y5PBA7_9MYCO|nr:hypothetical protein MHPYR_170004 [uncultured Mycobacterium sp.]
MGIFTRHVSPIPPLDFHFRLLLRPFPLAALGEMGAFCHFRALSRCVLTPAPGFKLPIKTKM